MARVRKPKCQDCGSARCHVVSRADGAMTWLCGSCETLRNDPNAKLRKPPDGADGLPINWPVRTKKKPQKESLF